MPVRKRPYRHHQHSIQQTCSSPESLWMDSPTTSRRMRTNSMTTGRPCRRHGVNSNLLRLFVIAVTLTALVQSTTTAAATASPDAAREEDDHYSLLRGSHYNSFLSRTAAAASNLWEDAKELVSHLHDGNAAASVPFETFPQLPDVSEMANLSSAVYQYRKWKTTNLQNGDDNQKVCDDWNQQQRNGDVHCHWYRHDQELGTQVMIVSSHAKDYLAVVFAGTDDLKTSLLDVDIRKVRFGTEDLVQLVVASKEQDVTTTTSTSSTKTIPNMPPPSDTRLRRYHHLHNSNVTQVPIALKDCAACRVHSGFNNAVFANQIFDEIYVRVEELRPQFSRLFTTGHSLGAANAILTALALAVQLEQKNIPLAHPVTSLNFGCPQIGNAEFQDYLNRRYLTHANDDEGGGGGGQRENPYLSIWRFVLGWDLVPRLPEFFEHVGHTIQMHHPECTEILTYCDYNKWLHPSSNNSSNHDNSTKQGLVYYHHIGNETLQYASVPSDWSAKPYLWVPGALLSHAMTRYAEFITEWWTLSSSTWVQDFVPLNNQSSSHDRSNQQNLIDDDTYAEPPDDDATTALLAAF